MRLNKSQILIIETIITGVFGFPDIHKVFSEEIIKLVMLEPTVSIIILVSLLKILLVILSINWLIQLLKNIELTYRTKSNRIFQNYLIKLVITGLLAFVISVWIKNLIGF